MINQNDFLNFAFEEALNELNSSAVDKDVLSDAIMPGIMPYAEIEACEQN